MGIKHKDIDINQIPTWIFITLFTIAFLIVILFLIFILISFIKQKPFNVFGLEFYADKKENSQTININLLNERLDTSRVIDPKRREEIENLYKNETIQDGTWEFDATDISIPGQSVESKYCYNAHLEITNKSIGYFEMRGIINLHHASSREFIIEKNVTGIGYYVRNELSIIFRTYRQVTIGDVTTGLGTLYIRFVCVGNDSAEGYIIASNPSQFGIGIGTVRMRRKNYV